MGDVSVPVSYRQHWNDGFGARGWKLGCSIGEPSVIAATAETGVKIGTSVLVHDLLDHHLCGVGIGGHRNEAIALHQLAERTGTDPLPDVLQIIDEDLLKGRVNGETMRQFLPRDLIKLLPDGPEEGVAVIDALVREIGREPLRQALVRYFLALGADEAAEARRCFESRGLPYRLRQRLGLCVQQILSRADEELNVMGPESAEGRFVLGRAGCELILDSPVRRYVEPLGELPRFPQLVNDQERCQCLGAAERQGATNYGRARICPQR